MTGQMAALNTALKAALASAMTVALTGCSVVPAGQAPAGTMQNTADLQPANPQPPAPALRLTVPTPPVRPERFVFDGALEQGGWLRGQAPGGAISVRLDGQDVVLDEEGRFFAAFDRDSGPTAMLVATLADGRIIERPLTVAPRDWNIERVNIARRVGGASESFLRIRRPELAQIVAARGVDAPSDGWRQDFVWPVTGRISGRFGSQRVYRGEPGSYHSGIDIATGESGTPFVAPADGIVTLATDRPFSLEGYLLIIDHGMGLNSAFLHMSDIAVRQGDRVRQGQFVGTIGSSGRATGPHLHWSLKWRDARLDPLLFTGPMP